MQVSVDFIIFSCQSIVPVKDCCRKLGMQHIVMRTGISLYLYHSCMVLLSFDGFFFGGERGGGEMY